MDLALPVLLWTLALSIASMSGAYSIRLFPSVAECLYTVHATWKDSGRQVTWSFRT